MAEVEARNHIAGAATRICFPSYDGAVDRVVDAAGVAYDIRVSDRPENPSRLGVAVVPRAFGSSPSRLIRCEVKTPSLLRTQAATVHLPAQLVRYQDEVASVTSEMIGAASTWFEGRLLLSLKMVEAGVVDSLYTYFRSLLPTPLQTIPIWFSAASRRHGHYVLDPTLARAVLPELVASAASLSSGPASCVADFLNAAVPVEKTFAVDVIKSGKVLDIDFKDAKYKDDLTSLQLAEIAVFGGMSASAFPIYSDGSTYLIAAFPTEVKGALVPILEASRDELARRYCAARSTIDRSFRRLVARGTGLSLADLGEFTGAMFGSFMNSAGR